MVIVIRETSLKMYYHIQNRSVDLYSGDNNPHL